MGKYDAYASKRDKEAREQDRIELSVKVIEGLKDDALKCAMDLGRDVVVAPDGFLRIAEAIKASWAGKLEIATKELYREGGKQDGVLARVPGESMASYVSPRRRWYRSLTILDKTFSIPEHLQLEMMVDCAGITDHQQQLARLAATKPLTLETMSLALVQEYPLIHEKELSRGRERPHPVSRPQPSGRRMAHHVYDSIPGRQTMKDDLVPGHLGRSPLIIDDEDDENSKRSWEDVAELAQQHTGQGWSNDWKAGKQVRVVYDELDPELCCPGWMAARNDFVSVDILAHAVAGSELDDGLAMEEPARRPRLGRHPKQRHVFQFGKYRNESYEDVTEETPDYYFWGSQGRKHSKYLQHYLEWVTEHYDVDPVRSTLTSKATGRILEAKPSPTKGQKQTESQLKKSLRQEGWKQAAKCVPRCDPRHATRAGSNATHVRFTCLQCGTVTQGKRDEPLTRSPETCLHENTDARGSSSTTHRVYCKDCCQYVYECPQSAVSPKRCVCSCGSVQTKRLNKPYRTV